MKGAICFRAVIIAGMMIMLGACADGWSTSQVSPQAAAAGRRRRQSIKSRSLKAMSPTGRTSRSATSR
jgi:hypothetical protein